MRPCVPQGVGQPVGLQGVEALEIEHRLDQPLAGRIAVGEGENVGAHRLAHRRIAGDEVEEVLADQIAGKIRMGEARGEAMADRLLQSGVIEDGRGQEAAELRLAAQGFLCFTPDMREDWIGVALAQRQHIAGRRHPELLPHARTQDNSMFPFRCRARA